jgi:hypothetical protein
MLRVREQQFPRDDQDEYPGNGLTAIPLIG